MTATAWRGAGGPVACHWRCPAACGPTRRRRRCTSSSRPACCSLVDGYNVAKLGWPGLALADQRSRVLDALDELAARYGTDVHVVFDGADVGPAATGRRYLRVEFSPAGVTADEVIVRLAEDLPVERPVVVATNDGEVRAGARAAGANIVSSDQLLAIARR